MFYIPTAFCIKVVATILNLSPANMEKWADSVNELTCDNVIIAAIESGWRPGVVQKRAKAKGLMQITPVAVVELERIEEKLPKYCRNAAKRNLLDPIDNLIVGNCYFWYLQNVMGYDNLEAFAAYNGGNAAVRRLRQYKTLPGETANYLVKYVNIMRECNLAFFKEMH